MIKRFMSWLLYQLQKLLTVFSGRRSPARSAAPIPPEKQGTRRTDIALRESDSITVGTDASTDASNDVISFSIQPESVQLDSIQLDSIQPDSIQPDNSLAQPAIASSDDITDELADTHMRLNAAASTISGSILSDVEDEIDEQRSPSENIQTEDQLPSIHDLLPAVEQEIKESAAQYEEATDLDSLKVENDTAKDAEASEQAVLFSFDITESPDDVPSEERMASGKSEALLEIDISNDELPDSEDLPTTLEDDVAATSDESVDGDLAADLVNADLVNADSENADSENADSENADLATVDSTNADTDTTVDSTRTSDYSSDYLSNYSLEADAAPATAEDSDTDPIVLDSISSDSIDSNLIDSDDSTISDADSSEIEAGSKEPEKEIEEKPEEKPEEESEENLEEEPKIDTSASTLNNASLPYPWSIATPKSAANANEENKEIAVVEPEEPEKKTESIETATELDSSYDTKSEATRSSTAEPISTQLSPQQNQEHTFLTKHGVVKLLFTMKEGNFHGYIEPEDGTSDILFHQKYINEDIFESLERGVEVVVSVKYMEGKAYATQVELITQ